MTGWPGSDSPNFMDADHQGYISDQNRIAELEAALGPFAASAAMLKREERTDEDIVALTLGTDLTPSDFWQALAAMPQTP